MAEKINIKGIWKAVSPGAPDSVDMWEIKQSAQSENGSVAVRHHE